MESEFRCYLRLSSTDPTHRWALGKFDNQADAEDCLAENKGAYMEVWQPQGKALMCVGRFAHGVYHPESSERQAAARFVRDAVKQ